MTKQEQIEEMGQIICERCLDGVCLIDKCVCEGVCEQITAKELYNAGYRKADEVRKETAKEILSAVDNESNGQTIEITNYLRKKYGVEVEE